MKTRFDLEQELLNCWGITEDLERLLRVCEYSEDPKVADEISNIILGLKSVYDMRFQEAWDTFEFLIGVNDGEL